MTRLDRLARSTRDLLDIAEKLKEVGAGLRSLAEPWAAATRAPAPSALGTRTWALSRLNSSVNRRFVVLAIMHLLAPQSLLSVSVKPRDDQTIQLEGTAPSEPEAIADWLLEHDVHPEKVGLEIGGLARWLYSELAERGLPMICIDPRRLRALTKTMPVKTDRNDARAIA